MKFFIAFFISLLILGFVTYIAIKPIFSKPHSARQQVFPTSTIISDPEDIDYERTGAIEAVKKLPEVKEYITTLDDPKAFYIEAESRTDSTITVHVATRNDNHLSTFNWYTLNNETGAAICSLFIYENGKMVRSSGPDEFPC